MSDEWRTHAACKGTDTALFFPTQGQSSAKAQTICRECPVTTECCTASLHGHQGEVEDGVWGGMGHRRRRTLRIEREGRRGTFGPREPQPINHGTAGGYTAHLRRGEPACDDCLEAMREYRRNQRPSRAKRPNLTLVYVADVAS